MRALSRVLSALPADFSLPIVITLHRARRLPNLQAEVLGKHSVLPVRIAAAREPLRPRFVYLASPHQHLLIQPDHRFAYTDGHKIRHLVSSANPLFASAAQVFGPGVLAVVLTGGDRDATDGVQAVKESGGTVIVQDEATAEDFAMPRSAIETGSVDRVLPLDKIASVLVEAARGSVRH